jgi:hypothetical protein
MRRIEDVLKKAEKRYRIVWRDALLGTDSGEYTVALDPPSASAIAAHAGDVSEWLSGWRQWAARHPAITLRSDTIRTKFGSQPIYTHLEIPDIHAWPTSTRTLPRTGSLLSVGGSSCAPTCMDKRCSLG